MSDDRMRQSILQAMDVCLSGIQPDPFLTQRILKGETTKMKKRISFAAILVTMIILITTVALAVGIYEWIKPTMDDAATVLIGTDWTLDDKMKLIDLFCETGVISEDNPLLALCTNKSLPQDERENAAAQLIDSICGEMIRAQQDPSVLQQEEYPSPDLETVFTIFYRSQNPNAEKAEIQDAYDRWMLESELFSQADASEESVSSDTPMPILHLTEDDIRESAYDILSEIYNFNKAERSATQIVTDYDDNYDVWTVHFTVSASSLREALKNEWSTDSYNSETGMYDWTIMLSADGTILDAHSPEELSWNQLIPRSAFPHWDNWEDDLRAFMFCSVEERAAFCAAYKPIVDAFLLEHPDIALYFEQTKSGYADLYNETIYDITRQIYGIPSTEAISETEALSIAKSAYLCSGLPGVSEDMIKSRCLVCSLYIVTDPVAPVWKIEIFSSQLTGEWDANDHRNGYRVVINALNGDILEEGELFGTHEGYSVLEDALWRY